MSIGSDKLSKLRQAKREEEEEKLIEKKRLFPRNSLLLLRLHCSPVRPNSPKTFQTNGNRTAQTSNVLTLLISPVFPYNQCSIRGALKCHQVFSLGSCPDCCPPPSQFPQVCKVNPEPWRARWRRRQWRLLFPAFAAAAMRLHSMLKTQTTFTMGAPQQGGATWGAAAVPIVRSAGRRKREERYCKNTVSHLVINNYKQQWK